MLCVLLFCVILWEKEQLRDLLGSFSLTELTDLTEPFCALFRTHRTPSAYRYHRTLLLKVAVGFCEIGWLNVSVHLCEICSSVFFCEKKNAPSMWERMLESCWVVFSLTERTEFTELFGARFEPTERLRHTEFTERYCYRWRDVCERGKLIK